MGPLDRYKLRRDLKPNPIANRLMVEMKVGQWTHYSDQVLTNAESGKLSEREDNHSLTFTSFSEACTWIDNNRPNLTERHLYKDTTQENVFVYMFETDIARKFAVATMGSGKYYPSSIHDFTDAVKRIKK